MCEKGFLASRTHTHAPLWSRDTNMAPTTAKLQQGENKLSLAVQLDHLLLCINVKKKKKKARQLFRHRKIILVIWVKNL